MKKEESARVAIVKVEDSIEAGMKEAIELAGGLKGLEPGMNILIKPNVNSNDPFPATSNPITVAAIVNYVKRFNPSRIVVGDASNISYLPTIESMRTLGIYQAAYDAGAEVVGFEDEDWVGVLPEGAENWDGFEVPKMLLDADYVISQCVVKTHFLAIYSMALKNWMGVVDHRSRYSLHASPRSVFYERIAELNLARPADFVLLDGTKAMVTGGPFSGDTVGGNLIVATANITAADATGLSILKYLGTVDQIQNVSVWDQPVLRRGIDIGLGARSGVDIELVTSNFQDLDKVGDFLETPRERRLTAKVQ